MLVFQIVFFLVPTAPFLARTNIYFVTFAHKLVNALLSIKFEKALQKNLSVRKTSLFCFFLDGSLNTALKIFHIFVSDYFYCYLAMTFLIMRSFRQPTESLFQFIFKSVDPSAAEPQGLGWPWILPSVVECCSNSNRFWTEFFLTQTFYYNFYHTWRPIYCSRCKSKRSWFLNVLKWRYIWMICRSRIDILYYMLSYKMLEKSECCIKRGQWGWAYFHR